MLNITKLFLFTFIKIKVLKKKCTILCKDATHNGIYRSVNKREIICSLVVNRNKYTPLTTETKEITFI